MAAELCPIDLLPNEILEKILLELLRLHHRDLLLISQEEREEDCHRLLPIDVLRLWQMRRVSRRWKLLIERMSGSLEEVARSLCQREMPKNVLYETARNRRLERMDYCSLWSRWRRLNQEGGAQCDTVRGATMPSTVRALRHVGDSYFAALEDGVTLWVHPESSQVLDRIQESSPVDQIHCLSVNDLEEALTVDGLVVRIECDLIVALSKNYIFAYFIEVKSQNYQGFKINRSDLYTIPSDQEEHVQMSTYRNVLLVKTSKRMIAWSFAPSGVPSKIGELGFGEPLKHSRLACLWPYPTKYGLGRTTLEYYNQVHFLGSTNITTYPLGSGPGVKGSPDWADDLEIMLMHWNTFNIRHWQRYVNSGLRVLREHCNNIARSFLFRNDLTVMLTLEDNLVVIVHEAHESRDTRYASYSKAVLISALRSTVTAVHLGMNVIVLGTAKGEVFSYKLSSIWQLMEWDLAAWDWRAEADVEAPIVDIELVQTGSNSLSLMFFSVDRIYSQLLI